MSIKYIYKYLIIISYLITVILFSPVSIYAQDGTISPGQPCSTSNQCMGGGVFECKPVGPNGSNICAPRSAYGTGVAPRSAAENYIKGFNGTNTGTTVNPGTKQKGIVEITTEGFGDMALSGEGGVPVVMGAMTAMYLNQPASTQTYLADLGRNMGLPGTKDANAQGFGFVSIQPVLELWKLARNIALAGFVVVFTIIGIMIMLRSKIDPRTVITIQQAIPRTIVALILVIFSYAIIGLMIDLTSVLTRVGATILQSAGYIASNGPGNPYLAQDLDNLLKTNIFGLFWPMYNMDEVMKNITNLPTTGINAISILLKLDMNGLNAVGGLTGAVLAIAIFIAVIRTFFMLLEAYLKVTLSIILSPFQFLMFAIPGQGKGFGDWARGIMANLLIFPATFFMLAFAAIFYANGTVGNSVWYANTTFGQTWSVGRDDLTEQTQYWAPPGLGDWGPAVGPLLALAIILTTPKIGATVKELVNPASRPGAAEGEVAKGVQAAAGRIPVLGSLTRM